MGEHAIFLVLSRCGYFLFSTRPRALDNRQKLYMYSVTLGPTAFGVIYEPPRDKTNKMTCAPSEDSNQQRTTIGAATR